MPFQQQQQPLIIPKLAGQLQNTNASSDAVNALSKAMREGFVTAQDVASRFTKRAAQEEQNARQLAEATPDLIRAKQAQANASGAAATYGPSVEAYKKFAGMAGKPPVILTPDGQEDYAKEAEQGSLFLAREARKSGALERLQPTKYETGESNGQKVLLKFNKYGEHITPELEAQLSQEVLGSVPAGTAQAAVPTTGAAPTTEAAPAITAAPAIAAAPTTGAAPGTTIPGVGILLGSTPAPQRQPTEPQIKAGTGAIRMDEADRSINKILSENPGLDLSSPNFQSWLQAWKVAKSVPVVGPQLARAIPDNVREAAQAFESWLQGVLRLESGAAISSHEESWYAETFFPTPGDSQELQQTKARLRERFKSALANIAGAALSPEDAARIKASGLNEDLESVGALAGASRSGTPTASGAREVKPGLYYDSGTGKFFKDANAQLTPTAPGAFQKTQEPVIAPRQTQEVPDLGYLIGG